MPVYVDSEHNEWLERTFGTADAFGLQATDQTALAHYRSGIEEAIVRTTGEFAVSEEAFYIEYERKLYRWTRGDREWRDLGSARCTRVR